MTLDDRELLRLIGDLRDKHKLAVRTLQDIAARSSDVTARERAVDTLQQLFPDQLVSLGIEGYRLRVVEVKGDDAA